MSTNLRIRGRALQAIRSRHRSDKPLCVMCATKGLVRPWVEIDHVVPLAEGGADDAANRQGLCAECHALKTAIQQGYKVRPTIAADGWPVQHNRGHNTRGGE